MSAKHFSVLICTGRPFSGLIRTLEAIRSQKIPESWSGEICVIDNTPLGNTVREGEEWINAHEEPNNSLQVRLVHEPKRGLANARNKALAEARGAAYLFTDDDVVPCQDWIGSMLEAFDEGFEAVSGPILLAEELERPWLTPYLRTWFAEKLPGVHGHDGGLIGANMGFVRHVADVIGEFDPELGAGALGYEEETVYLVKIRQHGFRVGHVPKAVVVHYFDSDRLRCRAMLQDAEKRGVSRAVARHRYEQHVPAWMSLRLAVLKIYVPLLSKVYARKESEGCPGWMLSSAMSYAYLRRFSQLLKNQSIAMK
jgi:GT2 family glycosyltransferase